MSAPQRGLLDAAARRLLPWIAVAVAAVTSCADGGGAGGEGADRGEAGEVAAAGVEAPGGGAGSLAPGGYGDGAGLAPEATSGSAPGHAVADGTVPARTPDGGPRRRPLVFVDPGHGGEEAGAVGASGSREKDLVLSVARHLEDELVGTGLVDVELSRGVDEEVDLVHRPRRANVLDADVFISLHMNWVDDDRASGVETYYLNTATDEAAERLAHRENLNAGDTPGDLETILADLRLAGNVAASRALAGRVHGEIVDGLQDLYGDGVRDRGIRTALFAVLVRAEMPAILVELCFLSNPAEERRARTRAFQVEAARAMSRGIIGFLRDQGELPPPDPLDGTP